MIGRAHTLKDRIRLVRRLPRPARLAALVAALRVAAPDERRSLAIELLELALLSDGRVSRRARRQADEALVALLRAWPSLPEGVRGSTAQSCAGRWANAAAVLAETDPLALAKAATDMALYELAPSIGSLLALDRPEAAEAHQDAERAMLAMAICARPDLPAAWVDPSLAGRRVSDAPDAEAMTVLCSELAEAGWRFAQHRRKGVLLAALVVLASPGGLPRNAETERLQRLFAPGEHAGVTAARGVLRWSRAPAARRAAWRLLADRRFARPARDRLARSGGPLDHEAVLAEAHLALRPSRVAALRSIEIKRTRVDAGSQEGSEGQTRLAQSGPLPLPEELEHLSVGARRGLPRFIDALTPPGPVRRAAISPLLADEDPVVRFNASRICDPSELADYCLDNAEPVARSAMLRWSTVGADGWLASSVGPGAGQRLRLAGHLTRSPHEGVRSLAPDEQDRHRPWNHASPASRLVARRLLQRHPEAFVEQIRSVVGSGPTPERAGAIMVARTLGVCDKIERELIEAARLPAGENAVRLTATAARALGELDSDAALRALHFCLSHADGRVRANAAEAIGRRAIRAMSKSCGAGGSAHIPRPTPHTPHPPQASQQEIGVLLELKQDEHHRVRAGALRALFAIGPASVSDDSGDASDQLDAMLGDPRWTHRLAGVWLAERSPESIESASGEGGHSRTRRLAERIVSIAGEDPDERVRRRAMGCARRLLLRLTPVGSEQVGSEPVRTREVYS